MYVYLPKAFRVRGPLNFPERPAAVGSRLVYPGGVGGDPCGPIRFSAGIRRIGDNLLQITVNGGRWTPQKHNFSEKSDICCFKSDGFYNKKSTFPILHKNTKKPEWRRIVLS